MKGTEMTDWMTHLGSSALWGVGALPDSSLVPVSYGDIEADVLAAVRTLDSLDVPAGAHVLLLSTMSTVHTVWPFAVACARTGRFAYFADANGFDAGRVEMFTRRLAIDLVLGVTTEVLKGLAEHGDPLEILCRARRVAATPDVVGEMRDGGLTPVAWIPLGPAVAVECSHGSVHLDETQWSLDKLDGQTVLIPRETRAVAGDQHFVLRFAVESQGASCTCGRTGRIIVGEVAR